MRIVFVRSLFLIVCFSFHSRPSRAFTLKSHQHFGPLELAMASTTEDNLSDQVRVLGVCGGIGQGKSSACKLLVSDLDCIAHLDADSVAHSVYSPGSQAVKDVISEFGSVIIAEGTEDTIDRKELGKIVFAKRRAMARLEKIIWPHVKTLLSEKIEALREEWSKGKKDGDAAIIVLEAAILLDAGWDDLLDGVWAVRAPRLAAIERLIETRNLSKEEAEKRINYQMSSRGIGNIDEEVKKGVITAVIENNGTLDDLKESLRNAINDRKSWK